MSYKFILAAVFPTVQDKTSEQKYAHFHRDVFQYAHWKKTAKFHIDTEYFITDFQKYIFVHHL